MTSYSILNTSLGDLLLAANSSELTGIYFSDCKHVPAAKREWKHDPGHPILKRAGKELQAFLKGGKESFSVPLRFKGTDFQERVWREIARIPFGETITYTELAKRAGAPQAVRAAGAATGRNPLSIVVPCHRVVGKNGKLTGFAGGLNRKRHLLELEKRPRD